MSLGVLTGRPAEEMPGSTGDQLPELAQLFERVRQAMSGVVQALWPSVSLPEGLGEHPEKLGRYVWNTRGRTGTRLELLCKTVCYLYSKLIPQS